MKLIIKREDFLKPLQTIIGVVGRRQTMSILGNVLISVEGRKLFAVATDLEVELLGHVELDDEPIEAGSITVSGHKLIDICRTLPANSAMKLEERDKSLYIDTGNSRFSLVTIPAGNFPRTKTIPDVTSFFISQKSLLSLARRTYFAIAENHGHHYLNGLLLNIEDDTVRAVASDGHRMSLYSLKDIGIKEKKARIIIPKKGIIELMRLLNDSDVLVEVELAKNYIRILADDFVFTSKLIDSQYPDYNRLIPRGGDKRITVNCEEFKQALARIGILSNEILRSMHLELCPNLLRMTAHNAEQEKAEEVISIDYTGGNLDIGFNITYLMDILSTTKSENIVITFKNSKSGAIIEELFGQERCLYVVMPFQI